MIEFGDGNKGIKPASYERIVLKNASEYHYLKIHLELQEADVSLNAVEFKQLIISALKRLHGEVGAALPVDILTYEEKTLSAILRVANALRKIDNIFILGKPEVSALAFGSDKFDVYRLSNLLISRGWNLHVLQFPRSIHFCITQLQTKPGVAELLVKDIKECVHENMKLPKGKTTGLGAICGMAQMIRDRNIVSEIAGGYLDCLYTTDMPHSAEAHTN